MGCLRRFQPCLDARNDGHVLYTDAIIPGSYLLGYFNADHWAVALPVARTVPKLCSAEEQQDEFVPGDDSHPRAKVGNL